MARIIFAAIAIVTLIGGVTMSSSEGSESDLGVSETLQLERDRTALVFIEFQGEWIGEDARLRDLLVKDREPFDAAVANAARIIDAARANNWPIAHAGLDLREDPSYRLFNGGDGVMGLRRAIPNAETWTGRGAEFIEPFVPRPGEFVVKGRSGASVLRNSTLDPFLRNTDIKTIVIMGFATHVCVESTLREAHDMGYNVYVVTDASGAFTTEQAQYFEENIVHHFGEAVSTNQLLQALSRHSL